MRQRQFRSNEPQRCNAITPMTEMAKDSSFEALWMSVSPNAEVFDRRRIESLPLGVQRYLQHGVAAQTLLASAVRLTMHGEIKLKGWNAFKAEEVIHWHPE